MSEKIFNLFFELERRGGLFSFVVENEDVKKWIALCYDPEKEFDWFIDRVNYNLTKFKIEGAIVLALEYMPEHFVIKPFLKAHQTEIMGMIISEYNKRMYDFYNKCQTMNLTHQEESEQDHHDHCLSL